MTRTNGDRRAGCRTVSAKAISQGIFNSRGMEDGGWYANILIHESVDTGVQSVRVVKSKETTDFRSDGRQIAGVVYKMRVRQKKVRKFITMLLIIAAFFSGFFGHSLFNSFAREDDQKALKPYYTSIQLQPGDNLWNIANRYVQGSGYTVSEYVEELKRINGLSDGMIHSGEYLTIVYFAE